MKYIPLLLLLIHGLIHLLGFVKEFRLASVEQLSGDTLFTFSVQARKVLGVLWLCASVLVVVSTIFWWRGINAWWMIGLAALLLSQLLIVLYWQDAKFGAIANAILLIAIVLGIANWQFHSMVRKEVRIVMTSDTIADIVTEEDIVHLPTPVQRWLLASGVIGSEMTQNTRLKQKGLIRSSEEQDWMEVTATQYFNTEQPSFVWVVDAHMNSFISAAGRDKYIDGKGSMLIKPLALFAVVDADGPKIDQGAMLRYLSEICWMPSAALRDYLVWQQVDSNSATVTMTHKGSAVSALFTFDEQYRLKSINAQRYKGEQDDHLTDWYIPISKWGVFEGITVPVKGDVLWKMPDENFNYYQWEITDIEYNIEQPI